MLGTPSRGETWHGFFTTDVPPGWTVAERTFPDAPATHVVLATSPEKDVVSVAFFDGEAIATGLADSPLEVLLRAYLDGFHQARGTPVLVREPWSCKLDVPLTTRLRGERLTVALADGRERVVHACAARDESRGALVLVLAWRSEAAAVEGDSLSEAASKMMASTGFLVPAP